MIAGGNHTIIHYEVESKTASLIEGGGFAVGEDGGSVLS